jgi:hypothetical protein
MRYISDNRASVYWICGDFTGIGFVSAHVSSILIDVSLSGTFNDRKCTHYFGFLFARSIKEFIYLIATKELR